jgi:competence ComEA-like helix-hairpin-helix protein
MEVEFTNRKKNILLYFSAVAIFCLSLVWKHFNNENKTVVVYTTNNTENGISTTEIFETKSSFKTKNTLSSHIVSTKTSTVKTTSIADEMSLYIDINTADYDSLICLEGIGETLAQAIIRYREENGGFNNIEEIMNVHGIGEGIFYAVRDYIYVENPIYPETEYEQEYTPEYDDEQEYDNEQEGESEVIPEQVTAEILTEPSLTLEEAAPIDINSADIELLMLLPHVDDYIASKIIELRDSIHGFSHPYELLYVEGLSQDKVAEIIEYVVVEVEKTE